METALVASVIWGAMIAIVCLLMLTAPEGYEDAEGFHFGRRQ